MFTSITKTAKDVGIYHGHNLSVDTVKFKVDFQGIPIHVDRPKGFVMKGTGKNGPWERQYKYDYGFIPKTEGGDGDGLDVFIGPNKAAKNAYWAIQHRDDGSFDEYKVFLGFDGRKAAEEAYCQHIPKRMLKGLVTLRVDMMKSLLGLNPTGIDSLEKIAVHIGFLSELDEIRAKQ